MKKPPVIGALIGTLILVTLFSVSIILSAQSNPVLKNAGFSGAFTYRSAPEVEVAEFWEPVWLEGDDRQCPAPCFRPEFKPEYEGDICRTEKCQRWFTTFARQFAGIYQRVDVEQGAWYEFSCDVYSISEPDGQMSVMVGIHPWGGDVLNRQMIWGQEYAYKPYRTWTRVSVTAQAWGDSILVVLGGNNQWPTQNNAAYWDNCTIEKVSGPVGPTQPPQPTYTPYPTYTPQPTCEAGNIDYGRIKKDVATVVAEREPIRWPR